MKTLTDILKLITGNIDSLQKNDIYSDMKADRDKEDFFKKAKITWALMATSREMPDEKVEESYRALHDRISAKRGSFRLGRYFRYAAVLMLVTGISALSFYLGKQYSFGPASGMKYTSVVADKGQISKVILPDSSVVWLNSGTVLTYDNNYSYKNRNLKLTGQAFLDVRKNRKLPLVVTSGNLKVKVLGTRFDVNAYPDDNAIKVTLESGSVELLNSVGKSFVYKLHPGQMAEFEPQSGRMEVKSVIAPNYTSWKDGMLTFVDTPMAEVLKRLERKFDIEIEVLNQNVYKSVFNANFSDENLEEIMDYIQFSCPVTCQIIQDKEAMHTKVILK